MIDFKNVTKVYNNNVLALSNLNVHIDQGEFVFLVGPSGAGKSTFIKMLLKEVNPTAGSVIVAGSDLTKLTRKEIPYYRRKIGVVFQDFRLIQTLNVFENVAFALRVIGSSEKDIQKKVPAVLSMVGLSKKRDAFPTELSGGEQQRVSIARSIAKNPTIMFCDEPTGALDEDTGKQVLDIIQNMNEKFKTTIVVITHNPNIALMADRVIKMNSAKIIEITENDIKRKASEIKWA